MVGDVLSKIIIFLSFGLLLTSCISPKSSEGNSQEQAVARNPNAEASSTLNSITCDLQSDRCSGKPLKEIQFAKSLFLSDLVESKLEEIEASEKARGQKFKVAFLGRMGSDLSRFQPLIDKNSKGQSQSLAQIIEYLVQQSAQNIPQSGEMSHQDNTNKISYPTMRKQFDRSRSMKFSHLGIAVKNLILKDARGKVMTGPSTDKWAVIHLLYSCEDQKQSYIFKGTVANFFYDHMHDYGAQIIVPTRDLQNNIEQILIKDYIGKNWVEKQYNALALANDLQQQNSNQWVLEVIAAGLYPAGKIQTRAQAQKVLQDTGYSATKVTPTGLYTAIQAPIIGKVISSIMPTVCLKSQPTVAEYGVADIISSLSIEEYLTKLKRVHSLHEVSLTAQDKIELDERLGSPKTKNQNDNFIN